MAKAMGRASNYWALTMFQAQDGEFEEKVEDPRGWSERDQMKEVEKTLFLGEKRTGKTESGDGPINHTLIPTPILKKFRVLGPFVRNARANEKGVNTWTSMKTTPTDNIGVEEK
ncbi:hypothetical protein Q3G72_019512 [Acer saccharum]|nr:hypothetical protein Q3G72_019512 [Acer saccharum]